MDGIPQLRIASLNIHGWRDRNGKLNRLRVKEELQRINADIIALQEVKSPFPISNAKTSQEETENERIISICYQGRTLIVGFDVSMSTEQLHTAICQQLGLPSETNFKLTTPDMSVNLSQFREESYCDYRRRPKRYDLQVIGSHPKTTMNVVKNDEQLSWLAKFLHMEYSFQPALDETFGNAILWRRNLAVAPQTLSSRVTVKFGVTEARSFVSIIVTIDGVPLTIYNTHLDDKKEEIRLHQMRMLLAQVDHPKAHLIVGDLNALRCTDYSNEKLAEITATRKEANIEDPKFDLLKELEEKHHYRSGVPFDITCEYGTRIDYILLSSECEKQFTANDARTVATEATDHALITIALSKKNSQ